MDLQSGYPYSLVKNGLPYNYPALDKNIRTTVAVIGGGISGALTAHALTVAGIPCVVLDARTIGLGSTAASTSLLQYEIDIPLSELVSKIGATPAQRAYELCALAIDEIKAICRQIRFPHFNEKPSLYLASYKKDLTLLEKEYAARKQLGLKIEQWDSDTVLSNMGFAAPGALYSQKAAQTDAYLLTHALHQYNIKKGAQVYDRTMVDDIDFASRGATLHTSHGYTVKTRYIVAATGYESLQYIQEPVVQLHSTYAMVSEPLPVHDQWYNDCMIWETKTPYLYMGTTMDNRIMIGGRDEPFYNPSRRDKLLASKARLLMKDFQVKFPHIPFTPGFKWTGTFGATKDGLPYIGRYAKMPHTFFALGFGGNGITFSQIAATIVTDLISGKKNPDADIFSFDRLKTE